MNLVRLIIIAVLVWLVLHLLRRLFKRPTPSNKTAEDTSKNMVRCAHCGLHLPEREAIAQQGRFFCCEEHRRQYRSPP